MSTRSRESARLTCRERLKRPAEREVLPEREPLLVVLRHQDAAEIRMAPEAHAVHVPHLAFEPVGGEPQVGDAVQLEVVHRHLARDPQLAAVRHGPELVPHLDRGSDAGVRPHDIREQVVRLVGRVAEEAERLGVDAGIDPHDRIAERVASRRAARPLGKRSRRARTEGWLAASPSGGATRTMRGGAAVVAVVNGGSPRSIPVFQAAFAPVAGPGQRRGRAEPAHAVLVRRVAEGLGDEFDRLRGQIRASDGLRGLVSRREGRPATRP